MTCQNQHSQYYYEDARVRIILLEVKMRIYIFLALVLPIALMLLSFGLVSLIPGCTVDEGAGASAACGAIGPLLALGILGGFLWLIFGIFCLIPASIIRAWINRNSTDNTSSNYTLRALEANEKKSKNTKK